MKASKNKSGSKKISLEDQYNEIMSGAPDDITKFSKWEMVGDMYKQFSLYDWSQYDTVVSSNII